MDTRTNREVAADVIQGISDGIGEFFKLAWYSFWLFCIVIFWCFEWRNPMTAIGGTAMYMAVAYLTPRLFRIWEYIVKQL
jgi:hypothetical protein